MKMKELQKGKIYKYGEESYYQFLGFDGDTAEMLEVEFDEETNTYKEAEYQDYIILMNKFDILDLVEIAE